MKLKDELAGYVLDAMQDVGGAQELKQVRYVDVRAQCDEFSSRPLLPPPNRNRLLPISITLWMGRNPRIRGFGWGRVGVGVGSLWHSGATLIAPTPNPSPQGGGEEFAAPPQRREAPTCRG